MKKIIGYSILTVVVVCGLFFAYTQKIKEGDSGTEVASVVFTCEANKTIGAIFYKDSVRITLSDGRKMILPQVVSGSGARYANTNESVVFWNKGNTSFIEEKDNTTFKNCVDIKNTQNTALLANPSSKNCTKLGGTITIEKRGDGGEYGLCSFDDNRSCEEWALMRGECPYGGRRTTGFDTIDQKYCAWNGGDTLAVTSSQCIFKNGVTCPTIDFYNGTCSSLKK
jgi:hypothetical protein